MENKNNGKFTFGPNREYFINVHDHDRRDFVSLHIWKYDKYIGEIYTSTPFEKILLESLNRAISNGSFKFIDTVSFCWIPRNYITIHIQGVVNIFFENGLILGGCDEVGL